MSSRSSRRQKEHGELNARVEEPPGGTVPQGRGRVPRQRPYRRLRAPSASEPAPPASNIVPAASVIASRPAPELAPSPVFGGWIPAPAAPPAGLVAVADGGTGVSVGATVGSAVLVAGTVAVNVGVAVRTVRFGVHVGTAKSASACGAEFATFGTPVASHGMAGNAAARRAGIATPIRIIPATTAIVPMDRRSVRSTAAPPSRSS